MAFRIAVLAYFVIYAAVVIGAPYNDDVIDDLDLNESIVLCAKEIGLLVEETRRSFTMPMETPGNCVMACVWQKIGLMEMNGKIMKEEMVSSLLPSADELPDLPPMRENNFYQCVDEANMADNSCDVVTEYFRCLIKDLFIEST